MGGTDEVIEAAHPALGQSGADAVDFDLCPSQTQWLTRVRTFIADAIRPAASAVAAERAASRAPSATMERLKDKACGEGLWNLFLPPSPEHDTDEYRGAGLTNLDYALCAEEMGKVGIASECFNCAAPDTGNMEVLLKYGSQEQRDRWLEPLLDDALFVPHLPAWEIAGVTDEPSPPKAVDALRPLLAAWGLIPSPRRR